MMRVRTRAFRPHDVDFATEQTSREGWATHPEWFRIYGEHDPEGCFIAEVEGTTAGMVTTTRYTETAWIGNLIVLPEFRRRGLGTALMEAALKYLEKAGIHTVRLEADPPGVHIYRRLGFVDEFESLRFHRPKGPLPSPASSVEMFHLTDLETVIAFDHPRFGDRRSHLLPLLHAAATDAFLVRRGGRLTGYALLQPTTTGRQLGPLLADDLETARGLLTAALAAAGEHSVDVGVPATNRQGVALFEKLGFDRRPSSARMVRGKRHGEGLVQTVFAIVNGAVG